MAKHALLELATVPRDRTQLQGLISEARAARRRARMFYAIAAVAFCAALFVLFTWYSSHAATPAAPKQPPAVVAPGNTIYLPLAIR